MKIKETIAYKQGKKAASLGVKLEKSGLVNLHPESDRYDQFIAGYDSVNQNKTLIAFQVGDNDIVAAYDEKEAVKILCEYSGCLDAEDFDDSDVTDLTSKLNEMLKDEEGNDLETLGDWLKRIYEPEYLYGWE